MADAYIVISDGPATNIVLGTETTNIVLSGIGTPYTAGTGISINSSNVITNTAPNVVQTLSIAGQDLTLSGGGGTVAIPSGASDALGTGFTSGGGSGAIPSADAVLEETAILTFRYFNNNNGIQIDDEQGTVSIYDRTGANSLIFNSDAITLSAFAGSIAINNGNDEVILTGPSTNLGFQYAADYSATIVTNPTSVTDVASVNLLKQTPVSYTNAAAPNNTIFYSTTDSKLSYKDPGGTVHNLY